MIGLVPGSSLANHPDSESFLVVHTLFSQDWMPEREKDSGRWSDMCPLLTFPELFQLVEAY